MIARRAGWGGAALVGLTLAAMAASAQPAAPLLPGIPGLSAADIATMPDAARKAGCAVKSGEVPRALAQASGRLGITAAQQGAWDRSAREMTEAVAPLAAECDRPPQAAGSLAATLDRLRGDAALAAALSRVQAAAQGLYGALTPAQQQMINQAANGMRDRLPGIIAGQTMPGLPTH